MPIAFSLLSSEVIKPKHLGDLFDRLKATRDEYGWVLARNDRQVFIEMAEYDPSLYSDKEIREITSLLGRPPRSKVVLMFDERSTDQFELRMAKAVSKAVAELWPIVLDDGTSKLEFVRPPGIAGQDS